MYHRDIYVIFTINIKLVHFSKCLDRLWLFFPVAISIFKFFSMENAVFMIVCDYLSFFLFLYTKYWFDTRATCYDIILRVALWLYETSLTKYSERKVGYFYILLEKVKCHVKWKLKCKATVTWQVSLSFLYYQQLALSKTAVVSN